MPTVNEVYNFEAGIRVPEGKLSPLRPRSELKQDALASYLLPFTDFRVWDALQTLLPGTSSADDLGIVGGTFGTATPSLQTEDLKTLGATNKRARVLAQLPPEYEEGETVVIRCNAGMLTTIADVTATLDVEAFLLDREAGVEGADLISTALQSINNLVLADKDFNLTPTNLAPGSILDIRFTLAVNDAAGLTAVKGILGIVELLCDIKG